MSARNSLKGTLVPLTIIAACIAFACIMLAIDPYVASIIGAVALTAMLALGLGGLLFYTLMRHY